MNLAKIKTAILVMMIAIILSAVSFFYCISRPLGIEVQSLIVEPGSSFSSVISSIHSAVVPFKILYRVRKSTDDNLQIYYGEYHIQKHHSIADILDKLCTSDTVTRMVVITEGMTMKQAKDILNAAVGLQGEVTIAVKEGEIWPDTYHYSWFESKDNIISSMKAKMQQNARQLWEARQEGLPFDTLQEALILASIVEKEAIYDVEKPIIASVFINRLRKGMKLQADPTVIYGVHAGQTDYKHVISKADLRNDSKYNTYIYAGLPPGPISNPGAWALKAVLHPAQTRHLYFVADGITGLHRFAPDYKTHAENVLEYRKQKKKLLAS